MMKKDQFDNLEDTKVDESHDQLGIQGDNIYHSARRRSSGGASNSGNSGENNNEEENDRDKKPRIHSEAERWEELGMRKWINMVKYTNPVLNLFYADCLLIP